MLPAPPASQGLETISLIVKPSSPAPLSQASEHGSLLPALPRPGHPIWGSLVLLAAHRDLANQFWRQGQWAPPLTTCVLAGVCLPKLVYFLGHVCPIDNTGITIKNPSLKVQALRSGTWVSL